MASTWTAPRSLRDFAGVVSSLVGLESFLVNGGLPAYQQPRRVTAATTLRPSDRLLLVDTTGGAVTVTLPLAQEAHADEYNVKLLAGANNVTLQRTGSDSIYTTAAVTSLAWNTTGDSTTLVPCLVVAPGTWGWVVV